jgi:hypothetical protein
VYVAALGGRHVIPPEDSTLAEQSASHPFRSSEGGRLYFLPTTPSRDFRSVVRARPFDASSEISSGDAFTAFTSSEMVVPTSMVGMTPVATSDRIILVMGDFRGDVWTLDLGPARR